MNVSSLELSQELFDLSGWEADYAYENHGTPDKPNWTVLPERLTKRDSPPAYNLGYLLRMLQAYSIVFTLRHSGFYWVCDAGNLGNGQSTDSPENASCRLAIELFKQGILKP